MKKILSLIMIFNLLITINVPLFSAQETELKKFSAKERAQRLAIREKKRELFPVLQKC